jgi:uncharacterized protein YggE
MRAFVLVLLVAMAVAGCATAGPPAADVGITTMGIGRVSARPDSAVVDVGVETRSPQLAAATAEVNRRMREVLARVKAFGVAEADLQTASYRVVPIGEPRQQAETTPRIVGYQVTTVVHVHARDVDRVGALVDAAVAAGANVVGNVQFRLAEPARLEAEARRLAVADAQAKARQVATAAGVTLGPLIAMSESPVHQPVPVSRMTLSAAGAPIEAGQLEVAISVTARYAIGP